MNKFMSWRECNVVGVIAAVVVLFIFVYIRKAEQKKTKKQKSPHPQAPKHVLAEPQQGVVVVV